MGMRDEAGRFQKARHVVDVVRGRPKPECNRRVGCHRRPGKCTPNSIRMNVVSSPVVVFQPRGVRPSSCWQSRPQRLRSAYLTVGGGRPGCPARAKPPARLCARWARRADPPQRRLEGARRPCRAGRVRAGRVAPRCPLVQAPASRRVPTRRGIHVGIGGCPGGDDPQLAGAGCITPPPCSSC